MKESNSLISNFASLLQEIDNIETQLADSYTKQSEIDLQITDLSHFIEELPMYYEKKLTPNQCYELVYYLQDLFMVRREFKKEQSLHDTLQSNCQKLGYSTQRGLLIAELKKKEKELESLFKPRRLSYEEIWNTITKSKIRNGENPFRKDNADEKTKDNLDK